MAFRYKGCDIIVFTDYAINKNQSTCTNGKKTVVTKIVNSGIKGLKISQWLKITNSIFNTNDRKFARFDGNNQPDVGN